MDVDVSKLIANSSGTAQELRIDIDSSASQHARVEGARSSTTISIDLTDQPRAVPYTVTNTTYEISSTAFIQVPAYGVFSPVLRPKAPVLKVNSRQTLTINIADYVKVGAGKTAYVESASSVTATKAGNGDLYVNDQTLKFTASEDYAGPGSISFTAVDGKRDKGRAKILNTSVLTLPITIMGKDVPPPIFSSPTIDIVAGEKATLVDLKALTHSPNDLFEEEKDYTYSCQNVDHRITASCSSAGKLSLKAQESAKPGSMTSVPVTIRAVETPSRRESPPESFSRTDRWSV